MTGVFYISDPHFYHARLAEIRGFGTDIELHNEAIVHNYHSLIKKKDDLVYFLGDLTVGGTAVEEKALELISKLPGRKRIIFGNHDSPSSVHRNPHKNFQKYMQVFEYAAMYMRLKLYGKPTELSHFPFARDHKEVPRYMEHRRPDYGQWLVHGHVHDEIIKQGRQIHVGLDAHQLMPVNQEEVIEYMRDPAELIIRVGKEVRKSSG